MPLSLLQPIQLAPLQQAEVVPQGCSITVGWTGATGWVGTAGWAGEAGAAGWVTISGSVCTTASSTVSTEVETSDCSTSSTSFYFML